MENYKNQLTQKTATDIPCVKEFRAMFPAAKVGVFSEYFKKGTTRAQIVDVVYDHYLLTLTVHFEVNPRTLGITSYESPLITLVEITSIEGSAEGPIREIYGTNYKISDEQWRKVVEAGGQFSVVGIDVKTNEPVVGIEKLKAYLRRSPIQ